MPSPDTLRIAALAVLFFFAANAFSKPCQYKPVPSGLAVREGYTEFMTADQLSHYKKALPKIADPEIAAILGSPDTLWYDEHSMVFAYQDSVEPVVGIRANCVARVIGESSDVPGIKKLTQYFVPDYRFLFPFRMAAGTDETTNVSVINFWSVPRKGNSVLPVKYWKLSSRGRYRWVFPVGTVFGEVLFQRDSDGGLYPFEVRIRKRYRDGWDVDLFRPFRTAMELRNAIEKQRPGWKVSINLREVMAHLENPDTLTPARLETKAYAKSLSPIEGTLDLLPPIEDPYLVRELLTQFPFVSTQGAIWKENATHETYGPASQGTFSVVPKGYTMGLIPVNEVSCKRCHDHTGRRLRDFEFDITLYGEIWGEDQIFTWHLFDPVYEIYGAWDDSQGSRRINKRLVDAILVKNEQPSASDPDYKQLPTLFVP